MAEQHDARNSGLAGRTLKGKWRLDAPLGIGGMASVWSARHRNGKRVAIKILHPELAQNDSTRTRFLREGYVANKVGHPGVVTILDDDVDDDLVFLVMELLDGETLNDRWKRNERRLSLREVLRVTREVLDALAAAHEQGIVHRDVKPANIFITTNEEVKILDFGIARLREGEVGTGNTTKIGATLGSPSFMSPEQARARWEFVDGRTDLWAVGAVMFTMLSGEHVHEGRVGAEILIATATQTARSLREVWSEAPDVVAAIVDRALAFERSDRWQDARSMQAAIERALKIDFEKPRAMVPSIADVSSVQPPAQGPVALANAAQLLGALESSASQASEPREGRDVDAGPRTQATGLMPTMQRAVPLAPVALEVEEAPPSAPLTRSKTAVMVLGGPVPSPLAPSALAALAAQQATANAIVEASESRGPPAEPDARPLDARPPHDSRRPFESTSAPTSLPTSAAPAATHSLRGSIVLGASIVVGMIASAIAFAFVVRHAPQVPDAAPVSAMSASSEPAASASASAASTENAAAPNSAAPATATSITAPPPKPRRPLRSAPPTTHRP